MTDSIECPESVVRRAYKVLLQIPHDSELRWQPDTQHALCSCLEVVAEWLGEERESVQDRFEAEALMAQQEKTLSPEWARLKRKL